MTLNGSLFNKLCFSFAILLTAILSGCGKHNVIQDPNKRIVVGQTVKFEAAATSITISYPVSNVWTDGYLPYIFEIKLIDPVTKSQVSEFNNNKKTHTGALYFEMHEISKTAFTGQGELIGYGDHPAGRFNPFALEDINNDNFHPF